VLDRLRAGRPPRCCMALPAGEWPRAWEAGRRALSWLPTSPYERRLGSATCVSHSCTGHEAARHHSLRDPVRSARPNLGPGRRLVDSLVHLRQATQQPPRSPPGATFAPLTNDGRLRGLADQPIRHPYPAAPSYPNTRGGTAVAGEHWPWGDPHFLRPAPSSTPSG